MAIAGVCYVVNGLERINELTDVYVHAYEYVYVNNRELWIRHAAA